MSSAERRGPARLLRGGLAASSATLVALVCHLAGGGQMPGWPGIVLPLVFSLQVCTALAGRGLSLWRLSASVAVSQLLFHLLFVLGTTPAGRAPAAADMHGHAAHGQGVLSAATGPTMEMVHASPMMWAWHGVAALVTVGVLYRGELMVLRIRQAAGRAIGRRLPRQVAGVHVLVPGVRSQAVAVAANDRPTHPAPQRSPVSRRGPPYLLAV
ncbi:hypothetical protein UQW22_03420 [Isoptericola halotolerans]|uniref:hypothetical protein n=1 Tax=Isoptericola halotolerans TaxID=300560 RepID=UPI00388EF4E2